MTLSFPGESAQYRAARDRLLAQEVELRRSMEAVASARRELPPGGAVPEDYVFQAAAELGIAGGRMSELFAGQEHAGRLQLHVPATRRRPTWSASRLPFSS
jgi:predicted dithiol-disulfide oxidoreductase (DUF899 family)